MSEELLAALDKYAFDLCEGWCEQQFEWAHFEDCAGCLARRLVGQTRHPQVDRSPEGQDPKGLDACTRAAVGEADAPDPSSSRDREIAALRDALKPFAERETTEEALTSDKPPEWVGLSPEQRVEMTGERVRQDTENILRARQALKDTSK